MFQIFTIDKKRHLNIRLCSIATLTLLYYTLSLIIKALTLLTVHFLEEKFSTVMRMRMRRRSSIVYNKTGIKIFTRVFSFLKNALFFSEEKFLDIYRSAENRNRPRKIEENILPDFSGCKILFSKCKITPHVHKIKISK